MASLREWTVQMARVGLGWARTKLAAGLGRRGSIRAGGQDTVELVPGADAELGEHAAEMVLINRSAVVPERDRPQSGRVGPVSAS